MSAGTNLVPETPAGCNRDTAVKPQSRRRYRAGLTALLLAVTLSACQSRMDPPTTFYGALDDVGEPGEQVVLWQNWDDEERQLFWFTEQGSQIIPYHWATALEQAGNSDPFFDDEHMNHLRYIPQVPTELNPDGLPIGFTRDKVWYSKRSGRLLRLEYEDHGNPVYQEIAEDWLGMTCAACHTNQVNYEGKKIVVDGAPAMADFEGLMQGLVDSMEATLQDEAKFGRFAEAVLDQDDGSAQTQEELKTHLTTMIGVRKAWNERNSGDGLDYGYGRLDALNSILNEISVTALGIEGNRRVADAPTSYPFIWDAPHHDYIQWNGMVKNDAKGALVRNLGEVLGVFGALELTPPDNPTDPAQLTGYKSSVRLQNLGKLEHLLVSLWSPKWPDTVLPAIDSELAEKGEELYFDQKRGCSGCHQPIDAESRQRRVKANSIPVGDASAGLNTDRATAAVFFERGAATGALKGTYKRYQPPCDPVENCPLTNPNQTFVHDGAPVAEFLANAAAGTLSYDRKAVVKIALRAFVNVPQKIETEKPGSPSYKARPLNGIWATAPYLHNGSVPSLKELLKKPEDRIERFYVGSRTFDPDEVGFKYRPEDYGPDDPKFEFDTARNGNLKGGHAYPADGLTPDEIDALVEYLKTL